jgi:hypothetical protein
MGYFRAVCFSLFIVIGSGCSTGTEIGRAVDQAYLQGNSIYITAAARATDGGSIYVWANENGEKIQLRFDGKIDSPTNGLLFVDRNYGTSNVVTRQLDKQSALEYFGKLELTPKAHLSEAQKNVVSEFMGKLR